MVNTINSYACSMYVIKTNEHSPRIVLYDSYNYY